MQFYWPADFGRWMSDRTDRKEIQHTKAAKARMRSLTKIKYFILKLHGIIYNCIKTIEIDKCN